MGMKANTIAWLLAGLLILGMLIERTSLTATHQNALARYIEQVEITNEHIQVERIQKANLEEALTRALSENNDLAQAIASLRDKPEEIRYITKIETVLVPAEPVVTVQELPKEHFFKVQENIVVASFHQEQPGYTFKTYELNFDGNLVIARRQAGMHLRVRSSFDPEVSAEVPVDLQVEFIEDPQVKKIFVPEISLGVTASSIDSKIAPSLMLSTFRPWQNVNLGNVRVSPRGDSFRVGVDPISYNVGQHLPVLNNIWVGLGVSTSQHLDTSLDLTIGAKL